MENKIKVYVAGPDVFLPNYNDIMITQWEIVKKFNLDNKIELVFPVESEVNLDEIKSLYKKGLAIRDGNKNLIKSCDCVIANLSPFRSLEPDVGTSFEVGFASALEKSVYVYTVNKDEMIKKYSGKNSKIAENTSVENFQMPFNLMLSPNEKSSIHTSFIKALEELIKDKLDIDVKDLKWFIFFQNKDYLN